MIMKSALLLWTNLYIEWILILKMPIYASLVDAAHVDGPQLCQDVLIYEPWYWTKVNLEISPKKSPRPTTHCAKFSALCSKLEKRIYFVLISLLALRCYNGSYCNLLKYTARKSCIVLLSFYLFLAQECSRAFPV